MDYRSSSSTYGARTTSRAQVPRTGLVWMEEEPIRNRSRRSVPPVVQDEESFMNSPNRRQLVNDLRAQVRQQQQHLPVARPSPAPVVAASRPRSMDSLSFRTTVTSVQQQQQRQPHRQQQQLTTEQVAQMELEELDRTTSSLRKLQVDFHAVAQSLRRSDQAATATAAWDEPSSFSSSPTASPIWGKKTARVSNPVVHHEATPLVPLSPAPQLLPPQQHAPQPPQPQPPQPQAVYAAYAPPPFYVYPPPPPPPPMQSVYYAQGTTGQPLPPPQYYSQPYAVHHHPYQQHYFPAPVPAVVPQPFAATSPVTVPELAATPVSAATPAPIAAASPAVQEPVATASPAVQEPVVAASPAISEPVAAASPAIPELIAAAASPAAPEPVIASPEPAVQEYFAIPAHVQPNELEAEVAKREAARAEQQQSPEAATPDVEKEEEEETPAQRKRREILARKRAEEEAAQQQQHRAVVLPEPESPKIGVARTLAIDSANDVSMLSTAPAAAATAAEPQEDAEERAARFAHLLSQAERAPLTTGAGSSLVLFGTFFQSSNFQPGSSLDDADLRSAKPRRPRTILAGDAVPPSSAASSPLEARRRALSADAMTSPSSELASLRDRKPVLMEGTLLKSSGRSSIMGYSTGYQARWFILSGRLLLYTSRRGSRDVKRMIDLERIDVVTDPQVLLKHSTPPTPHCIGIRELGEPRMLVLCAETYAEILAWYKAIVLNVVLLCTANRRPQTSKPPTDRSVKVLSPEDRKRKFLESASQRFKNELPPVPEPQLDWFYPLWQKPKSYYDLLGVAPDATSGMIKKAYYKIARESHPDRSARSMDSAAAAAPPVASEDFAMVALAYETLISESKRAEYDLAERIKEELRNGMDVSYLEPKWRDADMLIEPRLRQIRQCVERKVTIFCDGELKCLYWQPASGPGEELKPLMPDAEHCFEMRFVQQILYFRDGPVDLGENEPPGYEGETKFFILGDRLHTGPFLIKMDTAEQCSDLVTGLRIARCEKSTLFKQKMDANAANGVL